MRDFYHIRLNTWSLMFRHWLAKRRRRHIPYGSELLARAAQKGVNYGRIRTKKRAR